MLIDPNLFPAMERETLEVHAEQLQKQLRQADAIISSQAERIKELELDLANARNHIDSLVLDLAIADKRLVQ